MATVVDLEVEDPKGHVADQDESSGLQQRVETEGKGKVPGEVGSHGCNLIHDGDISLVPENEGNALPIEA